MNFVQQRIFLESGKTQIRIASDVSQNGLEYYLHLRL